METIIIKGTKIALPDVDRIFCDVSHKEEKTYISLTLDNGQRFQFLSNSKEEHLELCELGSEVLRFIEDRKKGLWKPTPGLS